MRLFSVRLERFRNHACYEFRPEASRTLVVGANGRGKTNLLEAIHLLGSLRSFRGATTEAVVAQGSERAVVRGEAERQRRQVVIDREFTASGRSRARVNRQPVLPLRDLAETLSTVVFSPADLALCQGSPGIRRDAFDAIGVCADREYRAWLTDFERILRQRNMLLRQTGPNPSSETLDTLDVWDSQMAAAGEALACRRTRLVDALGAQVSQCYAQLADSPAQASIVYQAQWADQGLASALAASRSHDLRRGISLTGPHRDDFFLAVGAMPARTHASQGEQRTLALAIRLAQQAYLAKVLNDAPVMLLDDVFSELDADRCTRLVAALPQAQAIITSAAGTVPRGVEIDCSVELCG